jgi:hypothetical protein
MERRYRSIESARTLARTIFSRAKSENGGLQTVRYRKNFLRTTKIFAKTCCTISTISYNYQQVTSVFTHFKKRLINEEIDSNVFRSASYRSCRGNGSWFLMGDERL